MPANAGNMGSIPDPGRSHIHGATKPLCHNHWACALEPASHNFWSLSTLKPTLCNEKPQQWEACAPQLESSLHSRQLDESLCSNKDPAQPPTPQKKTHRITSSRKYVVDRGPIIYHLPYIKSNCVHSPMISHIKLSAFVCK